MNFRKKQSQKSSSSPIVAFIVVDSFLWECRFCDLPKSTYSYWSNSESVQRGRKKSGCWPAELIILCFHVCDCQGCCSLAQKKTILKLRPLWSVMKTTRVYVIVYLYMFTFILLGKINSEQLILYNEIKTKQNQYTWIQETAMLCDKLHPLMEIMTMRLWEYIKTWRWWTVAYEQNIEFHCSDVLRHMGGLMLAVNGVI